MNSYIISGQSFEGSFRLTYNTNGLIHSIVNESSLSVHIDISKRICALPMEEKYITDLENRGIKVTKVTASVPFLVFWDKYGYKIGNKERAQKLWSWLTETDRQIAMGDIKPYHDWCISKRVEKLIPEEYLSQKIWNGDYKGNKTLFN